MEYKGQKAQFIMSGTRARVEGFKGELMVAVIQYGADKDSMKYDVVPDSTAPEDEAKLPEVVTFDDKNEALQYALKVDKNKKDWLRR